MAVDESYDAIIIGAGHNGLVAGAYLAKAGLRTLILERRDVVGGALATDELASGARVPALAHTVGRLRRSVMSDLCLDEHGLDLIEPDVRVIAPQPGGPPLTLWKSTNRTVAELESLSAKDASAYVSFDRQVRSLAPFLAKLHTFTPPDINHPSLKDGLTGAKLARAYRGLDKRDARTLLRVMPMAVADFVSDFFDSDGLRGLLATRGVQYAALGPWSAGTTGVLLGDSAGNDGGAPGQTTFVRGGPAVLAEALASAARSLGAEIRTGAEVAAVTTDGARATGVALSSGEELVADAIVSGADPKHVLTDLLDPVVLGPSLAWRAGNIRTPGVVGKVNLLLSGVPRFDSVDDESRLHGRIVIAPSIDYVERAFDATKYGRISEAPYLEATIPSLADPSLVTDGRHVMSVIVQYAPYKLRDASWATERDGLGDLAVKTLEEYAPGLADLIEDRVVITPADLENDYGLTEGHPLHAEPGLDQFFAWRPLFGHARYRLGIDGLYLCGSGAHPGGGVTGAPGANAAREIVIDARARARAAR